MTGPSAPGDGPAVTSRRLTAWPAGFRQLVIYSIFSFLAGQSFVSFLTPHLRESGIPVQVIGVYFGAVGAIGVFGAMLGGWIADSHGRRAALLLADVVRLGGWSLLVLMPTRATLVAAAALMGTGWAAGSAYMALTAELAPPGRRASAYAVTTMLESAMGMVVPVVIGFAADRIGLRAALAVALIPAALTIWRVRYVPETKRRHSAAEGATGEGIVSLARPSPWAGLRFALSIEGRGVLLMGVIWWLTMFQFSIIGPARPLYVVDRFGVSWSGFGLITTFSALGSVIGPMIGGRIADRVGYARLMAICLGGSGVIGLAIPLAPTPVIYAVLLMLANLVGWTAAPCWGAVSAASSPREVRGSIGGLFAALRAFGGAVGGVVVGFLYARWIVGPQYLFATIDLVIVVLVIWARNKGWAGFGAQGWT